MKDGTITFVFFTIAITIAPLLVIGNDCNSIKKNDPAHKAEVNQWMANNSGPRFLENKGQMADMQGKAVSSLLFKVGTPGVDMYVTTKGLSYVFTQIEKHEETNQPEKWKEYPSYKLEEDNITGKYCRADMELVGADIRKENIVKEFESEDRKDYYLPQCTDGAMNIHSYEKITIKNIYPGIDWVLYQTVSDQGSGMDKKQGIKYDFIIHPGVDPSLIKLKYKWTDKPELQKDGSVRIHTPMGDITEGKPVSYGPDKEKKITTRYKIQGDELSFSLGEYYHADTLVIDPSLIWATYYYAAGAGVVFEEVNSISADGTNVWVTGFSTKPAFPTLNPGGGAYFLGSFVGGSDVFILQFNICGKLIWATYYGGSGGDGGSSINSDGTNVWVTGNTSSTDFPIQFLPGAYNQAALGNAGANNAFILQFSCANDSRKWATYFGGSGADIGNSISSDGTNVWVTGFTTSTDFPLKLLGTAYNQSALGNGFGNPFILQFSCSGSTLIWSTYYGGTGGGSGIGNRGLSISSDGTNVWVTGITYSTDFPLKTLGSAYNQVALAGTTDAFILQFSCTNSSRIWATYYGGGSNEVGNSISSDGTNVWLTGYTQSTDFPLQSPGTAYNQTAYGGTTDAFILQFNCANSSRIWATYYGGSKSDIGFSINSDGTNVWVTGVAGSNFPTKSPVCGFFQGSAGVSNVFILQFSTSGVRQLATYYGRDNENDGCYICSDGTNVFLSGDAELSGYPTVDPGSGAYYNGTYVTDEIIFIAKFNILCSATGTLSVSSSANICSGGSTILIASGGFGYTWGPSSGLSSTTGSTVTASPVTTTTYTVTGTASGSCTTQTTTVTVIVSPSALTGQFVKGTANCTSCGCKEWIMITATGGTSPYSYAWPDGYTNRYKNQLCPGAYTINIKDKNGCSINVNVTAP